MAKKDYSEDLLIQAPTAELLNNSSAGRACLRRMKVPKVDGGQIVCWAVHRMRKLCSPGMYWQHSSA